MIEFGKILDREIEAIGTQGDAERGYKDIVVSTRDGSEHVLRLSVIAPKFRERALHRYAMNSDPRDLLPAVLEPKFAREEFINSILPQDLVKLANAAAALLIGPEKLKAILRQRLGGERKT